MNELVLHIMDIVYNSISAMATLVEIEIKEDLVNDLYTITILDNGFGIDEERLATINDPFSTSRTSRKVGMGISLFELTASQCDGELVITSEVSKFTKVFVSMTRDHINRIPLGDIGETIYLLTIANDSCNITYKHCIDNNCFIYDSREVKEIVGNDLQSNIEVINWIKGYVNENLENLEGTI